MCWTPKNIPVPYLDYRAKFSHSSSNDTATVIAVIAITVMVLLTKSAHIQTVVVEEPVVSQFNLVQTNRSQHQEQDDRKSTEGRHAQPGSTHCVRYHRQLTKNTVTPQCNVICRILLHHSHYHHHYY